MPDLRWRLQRAGTDVVLLVEQRADDGLGLMISFTPQDFARPPHLIRLMLREHLRRLQKELPRRIRADRRSPLRTFSPVEVAADA